MRTAGYRVESICTALCEQGMQVAPRKYRNWKTSGASARMVADAQLTDALLATVGTPEGMYGRRKMTAHLRRNGHRVARCTVDRLMRDDGLSGITRGRKHRTTIPGRDAARAADLLDRDVTASAPKDKWVNDFTYVPTWSGFVYVALVIDCYSPAIVGWQVSPTKDTAMVTTALKMALLAETTIGLFKAEAITPNSPFRTGPLRTLDDVEYLTTEWVDWYNNRRHSVLGYVPPDEYESTYYAQLRASQPATSQP